MNFAAAWDDFLKAEHLMIAILCCLNRFFIAGFLIFSVPGSNLTSLEWLPVQIFHYQLHSGPYNSGS
jgi:hypothetical protein